MIFKWISILVVISTGLLTSWYLFSLYRHREDDANGHLAVAPSLSDHWGFKPQALGGFSYWSLILVSVLGLFLELLLIRWISSEIRIFAYFKNFVLISCFLGFGLGCYLCRRPIICWFFMVKNSGSRFRLVPPGFFRRHHIHSKLCSE